MHNSTVNLIKAPPLTSVAFWASPSLQAGLVAIVIAGMMAEEVISGPTELIAAEAEVVLVAGHPNLVLELSHGAVVLQDLPLTVWVDHARLDRFLYDFTVNAYRSERQREIDTLTGSCGLIRPLFSVTVKLRQLTQPWQAHKIWSQQADLCNGLQVKGF